MSSTDEDLIEEGSMIAFSLISEATARAYWPLPLAMVGLGLMLYYFLAAHREC